MVECEVCLMEYPEGQRELHRPMCVLRLVFRCSLCNEDYVSKEGLRNHLDVHEIADELKESYLEEIKVKHKLHECTLCNDQRAYFECLYWEHVEEMHTGLFLQHSDYGEQFQSDENKNDHTTSLDQTRDPLEVSDIIYAMEDEQAPDKVENMACDYGVELRNACESCGATFSSDRLFHRHKASCGKKSCPDSGPGQRNVAYEMETLSSNESSCAQCSCCGEVFANQSILHQHFLQEHVSGNAAQVVDGASQLQRPQSSESNTVETKASDNPENVALLFEVDIKTEAEVADTEQSNRKKPAVVDFDAEDCDDPENVIRTCSICNSTFKTKHNLRYHMIVRHTKPQHKCSNCSLAFHFSQVLHRHRIHCSESSGSGQPTDFRPPNAAFCTKCSQCGILYSNCSRGFSVHFYNYHKLFKCKLCGIISKGNFEDIDHKKSCVKKTAPGSGLGQKNGLDKRRNPRTRRKYARSRGKLTKSTEADADLEYENEEYLEDEENIGTRHKETVEPSECQHECQICRLSFGNMDSLKYHKIVAHTEPQNKCSICDKMFHLAWQLHLHERGCSKLRCHKCNLKFSTHSQLDNHNIEKHSHGSQTKSTEAKADADLEYENEEYLEDEANIGTRPKETAEPSECQYECQICRLSFGNMDSLKYHKIVAHTEPQNKCSICDKMFHLAWQLCLHERGCSKLRCQKCNIKFSTHSQLDIHNIEKHPLDNESKGNEDVPEDGTEAGICKEQHTSTNCTELLNKQFDLPVHKEVADLVRQYSQEDYDLMYFEVEDLENAIKMEEKYSEDEEKRDRIDQAGGSTTTSLSICPKMTEEHEDCQFSLAEISRYRSVMEPQTDKQMAPQDENIELKIDIKLEDIVLQDQKYHVVIETPGRPIAETSISGQKQTTEHNAALFGAAEIALLSDVRECQTSKQIVRQGENMELKLDIKVEDTVVHDHEYLKVNPDTGNLFAATLHLHNDEPMSVEAEGLARAINIKEEYPEDEGKIKTELLDRLEQPGRSIETTTVSGLRRITEQEYFQMRSAEISLISGVKELQKTNPIVRQGENMQLEMDIKVEDTVLQDHEYLIVNANPGNSTLVQRHKTDDILRYKTEQQAVQEHVGSEETRIGKTKEHYVTYSNR